MYWHVSLNGHQRVLDCHDQCEQRLTVIESLLFSACKVPTWISKFEIHREIQARGKGGWVKEINKLLIWNV